MHLPSQLFLKIDPQKWSFCKLAVPNVCSLAARQWGGGEGNWALQVEGWSTHTCTQLHSCKQQASIHVHVHTTGLQYELGVHMLACHLCKWSNVHTYLPSHGLCVWSCMYTCEPARHSRDPVPNRPQASGGPQPRSWGALL